MFRFVPIALFLTISLSCTNQSETPAAEAPTATVQMRDGSKVKGHVVSSSPKEIKIAAADKSSQTIPLSQVKRVDYADAAAPAASPAAAPADEERVHPTAAAITTKTSELGVGTEITVRSEETIDSSKAVEGQTFAAEVASDVKDEAGDVVIPRGSNAQIVIRSASKGGKFKGNADLVLDLASVSVDGKQYRLSTANWVKKGKQGIGTNRRTAEYTGGGAAVGAIIGAIAGGGKGAAIGAGSGAGAGALTQILTKGGSIKIPVESKLTFKLDKPLRVVDSQ